MIAILRILSIEGRLPRDGGREHYERRRFSQTEATRARKSKVYRFGSSAVTKPRGENFWPTAFGLIIYPALEKGLEGGCLLCGFYPLTVFADQIFESIDCFCFGDVEFHGRFADVKIHFAGRAANVAEVRIGHFSGTVHDTSHDGDLYAFQMQGGCFDFGCCGLQVEQRPSARWARHIICLEHPRAG